MTNITAVILAVTRTGELMKALRRDKREPDRKNKLRFEARLMAAVKRHWKRQAAKIEAQLQMQPRASKADPIWITTSDFWEDDEFASELVILLRNATMRGIDLFSRRVLVGIDYTGVNTRALRAARDNAYELIKRVDDTTREAVRQAVSAFVETPGMTIRDVMDMLPFDERRAQTVATTEITRAYSNGDRMAGEELAEQFPDVRIIKTWFTNNDDVVCGICGPLDGKTVDFQDLFDEGNDVAEPPAHVNCRCWMEVGTDILGERR